MTNGKTLIILLTYKSNIGWLELSMHSVALQTRKNFVCVLADSTPESDPAHAQILGLLDKWKGDPRFTYRHFDWVSTGDMTNKINPVAAEYRDDCEFVVTLADDDYLAPRFLEVEAGALEKDPTAGFAQCTVHIFGDRFAFWLSDMPLNLQVADQIGQNQFAGTCVMRMNLFHEFGGYDGELVSPGFPGGLEDFALFVHFLRTGWRYTASPEVLLFCRARPEQLSRRFYGTELFWPLIQKMCQKQGIECSFTPSGIELKYQQIQRSIAR